MSLEVKISKKDRRRNWMEIQQTDYSGVYMQNEKLDLKLRRFKEKLLLDRKLFNLQNELDLGRLKKEVDSFQTMIESSVSFESLCRPGTTPVGRSRPVSHLPEVNRDPTNFPQEWFTSAYIPPDSTRKKRSSLPPVPRVKRKKKMIEEDKPPSVDDRRSSIKSAPNRSVSRFELQRNETSLLPAAAANSSSQNTSFTKRGSDAHMINNRRGSTLHVSPKLRENTAPNLPLIGKQESVNDSEDKTEVDEHHVTFVQSRSLRELKEIVLIDNLANRVPDKNELRKKKILAHNDTKTIRIMARVHSFMEKIEARLCDSDKTGQAWMMDDSF